MNSKWYRVVLVTMTTLGVVSLTTLQAADQRDARTRTVTKNVDTMTFSGVIQSIDLSQWTITVRGHEVIEHKQRKVLVNNNDKPRRKESNAAKKDEDAPKEIAQSFKLDPACKVSIAGTPLASLTNLQVGNKVLVSYAVLIGIDGKNSKVAREITSPSAK